MGEQPRARPAALDRQRGQRRRYFGEARPPALRILRKQAVEAGVAVGVQEAATSAEQRLCMFGAPIGRVAVERSRRRCSTKCAHRGPQPPDPGAALSRGENLHSRIVGVQHRPGAVVLGACAPQHRNIYEVYESNASPLAKEALERIAELFEIETRINGRAPQERLAVRQQEAVPLLRTVLTC